MRYTETKLDKIVRIGMARIDQVFDKCRDDLEKLKPVSMVTKKCWFESEESEAARLQLQAFDIFGSRREIDSARYGSVYDQMRGIQNAQAGRIGQGCSDLGSLLADANSGRQGA